MKKLIKIDTFYEIKDVIKSSKFKNDLNENDKDNKDENGQNQGYLTLLEKSKY